MKLSLFDYDPQTQESTGVVYGTIELKDDVLMFAGTDTTRALLFFQNGQDSLKRAKKPNDKASVMTYLSTASPKAKNGRVRIDEP